MSTRAKLALGFGIVLVVLAGRAVRKRDMPFVLTAHVFSIGLYGGPSPIDLSPLPGLKQPVFQAKAIGDKSIYQAADPFLFRRDSTWYLFFEAIRGDKVHWRQDHGVVGVATSRDARQWTWGGVVLEEPFHMSYPQVFEWEGQVYMLPETGSAGAVRLYRAEHFPRDWRHVATLLEGKYADPSIFRYADRWWMFAELSARGTNDTLRLYTAENLMGPWTEHPRSPVVRGDQNIARPGGRVVVQGDRIFRFAQDDKPTYGNQLWAFEITRLTPTEYAEKPAKAGPVLTASGRGWNALGMHHADPHEVAPGQWIAVVDGIALGRYFGLKY